MSSPKNEILEFGSGKSVVIDGTSATTPAAGRAFGAIQIINDAVISAITMPDVTNSDGYTTITLPAGLVIYGKCTSITLTSGVVAAFEYKDK